MKHLGIIINNKNDLEIIFSLLLYIDKCRDYPPLKYYKTLRLIN